MKRSTCTCVIAAGLVGLVMGMTGCTYAPAPRRYSEFGSRVEAALPAGWLQFVKAKEAFTITKDGLRLEAIAIRTRRVGEKLKGTDRVYAAGMMPHEAADLTVGLIRNREELRNFEVKEIDAVSMAGRDGYRIEAAYVEESGLRKRIRMYGTLTDKYLYEVMYDAAEPVYFQKYEKAFEEVVCSVRIVR